MFGWEDKVQLPYNNSTKNKLLRSYFGMFGNATQCKVELSHPIFACVLRIALRFGCTYIGFHRHIWANVGTAKMQFNVDNAWVNRMCKRALNGMSQWTLTDYIMFIAWTSRHRKSVLSSLSILVIIRTDKPFVSVDDADIFSPPCVVTMGQFHQPIVAKRKYTSSRSLAQKMPFSFTIKNTPNFNSKHN